MAMHADLVAAIKAGRPIHHLVTVTLPSYTIRWALGGAVPWDGQVYAAHDATYGVLDEIGDITDGIDDDASPVSITVLPPTMASIADLSAADAQGGRVTIHLGCTGTDGQLVSEPYRLYIGELDQPRLRSGTTRRLEYDILTGDARGLQPNEEQRQTDAFHQLIWPGEKGNEYATDGTKLAYWREDEPKRSIGSLLGRGQDDEDDKAIQFTYEPNAPFAFPFGSRVAVSGTIRYQTGYGPTNRWFSIFATVGASGPVGGLISASFDDEVTSFDGSDRATNGDHAGEMWFSFLPGDQPSSALTSPTGTNAAGIPAPGWTSAHKLSGRPSYCWTGKENSKQSEFRGGVSKPIITMEGLLGWDPRLDSTWHAGSGPQLLTDPTTWDVVTDGCIGGLSWATGRWEGAAAGSPTAYGVPYETFLVGGIGAPLDLIDVDSFVAGAEIADANNWTMAGVPYSDQDKTDVLEDMLQAAGCYRARKGGMISCVPYGAVQASILTATASDTAAPVEIALAPSRLERKNTGIPSFWSEDHRWEMTPIAAVSDPAWVTEDGGRQTEGFDYRYVTDPDQAAQLCYYDLAYGRLPVSNAEFKPYMLQLEPGDCFDWEAPEYLLDGVKAKVLKRVYSPSNCLVKVSFRQEIDAIHTAAMAQAGLAPGATTPATPPTRHEFARFPSRQTTLDGTADVFPTSATETVISIIDHKAWFINAPAEEFLADTITGLTGGTVYGVFGKDGGNYEAEVGPALTHMLDDDWVFIGWQATPDSGGDYPDPPVPNPGWGGSGPSQTGSAEVLEGRLIAGDVIPAESATFTGKGDLATLNKVDTAEIETNAVNEPGYAFTSGPLVITADETIVQTVTVTTNGGAVDVSVGVLFSTGGTAFLTGSAFIKRDGTTIWSSTVAAAYLTSPGVYTMLQPFSVTIPDFPSAGSHTYDLCVTFSDYTNSPQVDTRSISAHLFKDAP